MCCLWYPWVGITYVINSEFTLDMVMHGKTWIKDRKHQSISLSKIVLHCYLPFRQLEFQNQYPESIFTILSPRFPMTPVICCFLSEIRMHWCICDTTINLQLLKSPAWFCCVTHVNKFKAMCTYEDDRLSLWAFSILKSQQTSCRNHYVLPLTASCNVS